MRRGALILLAMACLAAPELGASSRTGAVELDAANGATRWSRVLGYVYPKRTFNLFVTPLRQRLGDSVYSTEIQVHFGEAALFYSRADPRIINHYADPQKLPPIWDMRFLVGERAEEIGDARVMAVGAAGLQFEDGTPFLVQAWWAKGLVTLYHRLPGSRYSVAVARFHYQGPPLAVRGRTVGYKARFYVPASGKS